MESHVTMVEASTCNTCNQSAPCCGVVSNSPNVVATTFDCCLIYQLTGAAAVILQQHHRDVLKLYHALALRWFLVNSQYRAPVNYTPKALDEASDRSYYVYQTLADAFDVLTAAGEQGAAAVGTASGGAVGVGAELLSAVVSGLLDDLNTPVCISALSAPLKALNDLMTTKAGRKNPKR